VSNLRPKENNTPRKLNECKLCGWQWFSRASKVTAKVCPHCKSKFWNVGRQRAPKTQAEES
jgi:predicted Zn-ribbon and HTH transcriptional regulator